MKGNYAEDLTGKQFGHKTVIERGPNNKNGGAQWWVRCACGNQYILGTSSVKKTSRCGKCRDLGKYPSLVSGFRKWLADCTIAIKYDGRNAQKFLAYCRDLNLCFCWRCNKTNSIVVDHDHNEEQLVRGLLCYTCNLLEGLLWQDVGKARNELYDMAFGKYL